MGLFDMDPEYRACLMRGLMNKDLPPLSLVEFTKLDSILVFAREKGLELLIISDLALTREVLEADIKGIILLTDVPVQEDVHRSEDRLLGCIFKYQPVGQIAQELLSQYRQASFAAPVLGRCPQVLQTSVYGIYSPVKRCLKSSFSIALAQIMGERRPTLLVSFEEYSALPAMLDILEAPSAPNLSDALYYYLQNTLSEHQSELIAASHSFDFISPVKNPDDLEGLAPEDVIGFIQYFVRECRYSCLVIDFGDRISGINRILPCCSRVFMPVKADWISEKKKKQYLDYVGRTNPELLTKLQEVHPPYHHIGRESRGQWGKFDGLVSGEFYDYVRQCL